MGDCCAPGPGPDSPIAALGAWRGAAQPVGPAEQAVHQAILRGFASHGGPPPDPDLDAAAAEFESSARQILDRLHDSDVIRLDAAGRIDSADAQTGDRITVEVRGEVAIADPVTTVVFIGAQSAQGPAADTCCNHLNFFTGRPSAESWAMAHPDIDGIVVGLADATRCGAAVFGPLLEADRT